MSCRRTSALSVNKISETSLNGTPRLAIVLLSLLAIVAQPNAVFADCAALLAEVEKASARPQFEFKPSANLYTMPKMQGRVERGSSSMVNEFVYFTIPGSHADYAVVRKAVAGFGFSPAQVEHYELVQSSNLVLRDLQMDGSNSFFAAVLSSPDIPGSVAVKLAGVADEETGRLEFLEMKPLSIDQVKSLESVRLIPRPGRSDFWMVDGSDALRIIQLGEGGLELGLEMNVKALLGKDPKGSAFNLIENINFLPGGNMALITARSKSGRRWLVPLKIVETPIEGKDEVNVSYESYPAQALEIAEGEKLSARPDKNLMILYSPTGLRGVSFDTDKLELVVVMEQNLNLLGEGESISGFDYFWNGVLVQQPAKKEDEKPKFRFMGELNAYVLIFNEKKNETKTVWLTWGNPVSTSPARHSFMNLKQNQ